MANFFRGRLDQVGFELPLATSLKRKKGKKKFFTTDTNMCSCCATSNSNQLVIKTFKLLRLQGHKVSVITVLISKLEKV